MGTIIIGLGESGYSAAKYCAKNGISCEVIDTRTNPSHAHKFRQEFKNIPLHTGGFHPEILRSAKTIVLSPGIAKDNVEFLAALPQNNSIEIIGDIELFARTMVTAPIVAITGSNGKSTVTTLVGEMAAASGLKVGVGGNLGTPALDLLKPDQDLYVLELSSFQLETTYTLNTAVSTLLNICPDHMDRYKTLEDYLDAKARIFQGSEKIVMNRQEDLVASKIPAKIPVISFGMDLPPSNENFGLRESAQEVILMKGKSDLLSMKEMKLFGRHNAANALAALALGDAIHIPMESMISVLRNFKGLPHRCESVRRRLDVTWINDSKGTNVGATVSAIQGLGNSISGKWILIAGGISKNADFSPMMPIIQQYCRSVVLIGEAASELNNLLKDILPCVPATTMEEAVAKADKLAQPGDGVLLSPACASFDMFKNFEHRGEIFREAVLAL